jgi:hypothetical protein
LESKREEGRLEQDLNEVLTLTKENKTSEGLNKVWIELEEYKDYPHFISFYALTGSGKD